jgi:opacity protein-like surface antigen
MNNRSRPSVRLITTQTALAILVASFAVTAQASDAWYYALRTSLASSRIEDTSHGGTIGTGAPMGGDIDGEIRDPNSDDVTGGLGVAFGRRFGSWAVEADLHWRYRTDWDVSIASPSIQTITNVHTNVETTTAFVNWIRSGAFGNTWHWELGAGVGIVYNRLDGEYVEREVPGIRPEMTFDDDDTATEFGWGLLAGLSRPIGSGWRVSAQYRYGNYGEVEIGPFTGRTGSLSADYTAHELVISFEREFD